MKNYNVMTNIGRCKYLVNFHDGIQKHKDGGEFFDIRIFKNKPSMNAFIRKLRDEGYSEQLSPIYR